MYRIDLMSHAKRHAQSSTIVQAQIRTHEAQLQVVRVADGCRCPLGKWMPTHADFVHFPEDRQFWDARNRADLRTLAGTEHIRRRVA
jgi:hypothetical protein